MASLMHLLENDEELAAEMEKELIYGLVHKAMSARSLDAREGLIAELMSGIEKADKSYNEVLRLPTNQEPKISNGNPVFSDSNLEKKQLRTFVANTFPECRRQASRNSEATPNHSIFDKFDPSHVGVLPEQSRARNTKIRWFRFAHAAIRDAVSVLLTWHLLPRHGDLYFETLEVPGAFTAGVAGGYGIKTYQDQRRNRASKVRGPRTTALAFDVEASLRAARVSFRIEAGPRVAVPEAPRRCYRQLGLARTLPFQLPRFLGRLGAAHAKPDA